MKEPQPTEDHPQSDTETVTVVGNETAVPRKPRADKGKKRPKKERETIEKDFNISLKYLLIKVTEAIARRQNNPFIIMSEEEALEFDLAVNQYLSIRLPQIKQLPEVILIIPFVNYLARVNIQTAMARIDGKKEEAKSKGKHD